MGVNNLRAVFAMGGAFFVFCLVLSLGCGNPEAPEITNVRLSYWDSIPPELEDPDWVPAWVPLENGGVAPQSPVRIRGKITDNTAVVSPRIAWVGERGDVDEQGFTECSEAKNGFYECTMSCEETREGFYECNPLLPARRLIRGDLFRLTLLTTDGGEHELEVQVSEAQDLLVPESEDDPIQIQQDYRILRVVSQTDEPNPFLWSLLQRKTAGGEWLPLRSGDVLALHAGDDAFQLAVEEPEEVELDVPPTAVWRSLLKWNDDSFLNWDARTGNFDEIFQVFDPRLRDPESGQVIDDEDGPSYRFAVSAEDVPDQKTGVFRYSEVSRELLFSPERVSQAPDLEVDGEDEELIETSEPAENVTGTVESFSGEVRSLVLTLSEGSGTGASRSLYFDPSLISLSGGFVATLVYVSDWDEKGDDGYGVVDPYPEDGGIPNNLEVAALDVQGNWTRTNVPIVFSPSTRGNQVPELQIREFFPALDSEGEVQLPFGEVVRVRARAADDRGQPAFSAYQCTCVAEEPPINDDRCPCEALTGVTGTPERDDDWVDLNAGGEYPQNPWEWVVVEPSSETSKMLGVLLAKEKVERAKDKPIGRFSGITINLEPESEEEAYKVSVSLPETIGPTLVLADLKNGDLVDPGGFIVQATIFANVSELNQIKAVRNGKPAGEGGEPEPTFESGTGAFLWDLQDETFQEGDRICVGAISVTGHATLNLLEFATLENPTEPTDDRLLLGVTVTSDIQACEEMP